MFYYRIMGKKVKSDYRIQFAEQYIFDSDEDIVIKENIQMKLEQAFLQENGEKAYRSIQGECIQYYVRNAGKFVISKGNKIEYHLVEHYDENLVEMFILCTCFPILLKQKKNLLLHGSCVEIHQKGIIISGESGSGKSTLANRMVEIYGKYLSDDIVPVCADTNTVYPSFACRKFCKDVLEENKFNRNKLIRISEDEREKYALIDFEHFETECLPLNAIIVLKTADAEEVELVRKSGIEALRTVNENQFIGTLSGDDHETKCMMIDILNIVKNTPIYELYRPINGMTVDKQVQLIQNELEL